MAMIMMATLMIIIFISIFSVFYQDNLRDKQNLLAEDIGDYLYNEFLLASESKPGYVREFEIPNNLEGYDYKVSIINKKTLVINYSVSALFYNIPKTTGQPRKTENIIKNINNTICINC